MNLFFILYSEAIKICENLRFAEQIRLIRVPLRVYLSSPPTPLQRRGETRRGKILLD